MTNNRNVYVLFSETGIFSTSLPGREWKLFHRSIVTHIYLLLNALLLFLIVQEYIFLIAKTFQSIYGGVYSDWKEIGSFFVYDQLCIISIAQFLNLIFHSLQR